MLKPEVREKIKENFTFLEFNSHLKHNPDYDIVVGNINKDSYITFCKSIVDDSQVAEYYSGENYVPGSKETSYSRSYNISPKEKPPMDMADVPLLYHEKVKLLRDIYWDFVFSLHVKSWEDYLVINKLT